MSASFDVVIVGAGPVGLTLANLLGLRGVRTLVADRADGVQTEPRAVTLDDESLRSLQTAGLLDEVLDDVVLDCGVQYFDRNGKPLASILPTRQEYGFPKRNAFRQPTFVRTLLESLRRFDHVVTWFAHELRSFEQTADAVALSLWSADREVVVSASYLVACDGARSTVRQRCGIGLTGDTYPERWLIVDLRERTVPLRHARTYCDPRRPAIRLPGPSTAWSGTAT